MAKHLIEEELMDRAWLLAFQALLWQHFELDLLLVTDTRCLCNLLERFLGATVCLEVDRQKRPDTHEDSDVALALEVPVKYLLLETRKVVLLTLIDSLEP